MTEQQAGMSSTTTKKNKVKKYGIELEGRWIKGATSVGYFDDERNWHYPKLIPGRTENMQRANLLKADGSVNSKEGYVSGETASEPTTRKGILEFIDKYYPDHTGTDCGLHLHVSLTVKEYLALARPELMDDLRAWYVKLIDSDKFNQYDKERMRDRLTNSYCEFNTSKALIAQQIRQENKGSARYRAINFCHTVHGTVEFRLFPMLSNKKKAQHMIGEFYKWLDASLADYKKKYAEKKRVFTFTASIKGPEPRKTKPLFAPVARPSIIVDSRLLSRDEKYHLDDHKIYVIGVWPVVIELYGNGAPVIPGIMHALNNQEWSEEQRAEFNEIIDELRAYRADCDANTCEPVSSERRV